LTGSFNSAAIASMLGGIHTAITTAEEARNNYSDGQDAEGLETAGYFVERALIQTLILLDALALTETYKAVAELKNEAKEDYSKVVEHDGDLYLSWISPLRHYLTAIESAFETAGVKSITKDVIEILRGCQYAILDKNCFKEPPAEEADVHARIEAVLRCIFPDLRHQPSISKPIKNFKPDTGLPSIGVLIEYKFVSSPENVATVSDELLADTRGYISKEWTQCIYVIYETGRFRTEAQWNSHFQACEVPSNARVIVICGEEPQSRRTKSRLNA
jgi:hypothetical protein